MATTLKISEMVEADLPLDGTEDMEIVQDGFTRRCSTQDVADLAAGGGGSVVTVKVSLSSAEILALFTTPKVLVAAPGAGKILAPIRIVIKNNFGTEGYSGGPILINLGTLNLLSNTTYQLSNNAYDFRALTGNAANSTNLSNTAITASVASSNPTLGDGTVDMYITYTTITL